MSFAHLHVHSEYSLLDGACRIEPMLEKIKSMGQTHVAVTDHGVMYGAIEFYKAARAKGIQPIIGCECYVAPGSRLSKVHGVDNERYHLVLLCKNETGYRNLIKMVSESWTNGFYVKPRIDKDLLAECSDGLIALSGCLFGEVSRKLTADDYEGAKKTALWYKEVFGDGNYYLEIQNHGMDEQNKINPFLMKLSEEISVPLAATNDAHYINREDSKVQQVLICIQTNHVLGESTGLDFSTDEFYLKSEEEMLEAFNFCPEAVYNTQKIAEMCNVEFQFGNTKLPHFDVPGNVDHAQWFSTMCEKGLRKRYGDNPPQEYIDRMNYELDVINRMGYTDYYLIVHDFIKAAKEMGIPVGPGRGSGAASICAYCIGITGIDPMKYNLLFERFLNPERVSMPDFDIDFCYERRSEVIDYVIHKYGSDRVAQIVTFGTMAAKAAVRDVGRVMGLPYGYVDSIAKLIPSGLDVTLSNALDVPEFRQKYDSDYQCKELIDLSMKVEGMPRHASTHAAGVVITRDPVMSYVPLAMNDDNVVTQFTMTTLEELGLLKIDFLGLRTLTVIRSAEEMVKKTNPSFDINKIDIADKNVYRMFSNAKTDGVFQFESGGMKRVLSQFKPETIEDLIAIIALYRPGPMDSIPDYIKNRKSGKEIEYKIPALKNILDVTSGCIVYQEQVMQICREIAGYSYGRADIVRRAMAKKKHDVMLKERQNFVYGMKDESGNIVVDGAIRRGVGEKEANELFDEMVSFASYAFNKAHAAAYAYVSYQTAYLKQYYPSEFFAALLTSFLDNTDKVVQYIDECSRMGIHLLPPDINSGSTRFTVNGKDINFSLAAVKNLGRGFISSVVREREMNGIFIDFYDFCKRMYGRELNRRAVESMIKCGAFDKLGQNRRQLFLSIDSIFDTLDSNRRRNISGQIGFGELGNDEAGIIDDSFEYPAESEFPADQLLRQEKEVTGMFLSGHPLKKYEGMYKSLGCRTISEVIDQSVSVNGEAVKLLVLLNGVNKKLTRSNQTMAFLQCEDKTGVVEVVVFPKTYASAPQYYIENNILLVFGRVDISTDNEVKVICDHVENCPNPDSIQESTPTVKKKAEGLFLKFDTASSPQVECCSKLIRIFDGNTPLFYYYAGKTEYVSNPLQQGVEVNDVLLRELRKILGKDNVIFNK